MENPTGLKDQTDEQLASFQKFCLGRISDPKTESGARQGYIRAANEVNEELRRRGHPDAPRN